MESSTKLQNDTNDEELENLNNWENLICASEDIEIEIEENLRRDLINKSSGDNNLTNQLVDITFIKANQQEVTLSLNFNDLEIFLEMINNKKSQRKQTVIENNNEEDVKTYKSKIVPNQTTIYTAPYTFDNVRKKLKCMATSPTDDKPGTPCLCQHCGMVGVLVESQKRPAIPHAPNPKFNNPPSIQANQNQPKRRVIDLRSKSKSETNIILLKELANKIAALEGRLNEQEEKTVRKDYFKFVIQKLLSQYSNKLHNIRRDSNKTGGISISTQYSKVRQFTKDRQGGKSYATHRFQVVDDTTEDSEPHTSRKRKESIAEDLKGRITSLIEEKFKSHKKKNDDVFKLPANPGEINPKSVYSAKCCNNSPFHTPNVKNRLLNVLENELNDSISSETIQKLCDLISLKYNNNNNKIGNKRIDEPVFRKNAQTFKKSCHNKREIINSKNYKFDIPEELLNKSAKCSPAPAKTETVKQRIIKPIPETNKYKNILDLDSINVSYVNPAANRWMDDQSSETENGLVKPKAHNNKKNNGTGHSIEDKIKYLKNLAKQKNVDESELWHNILNQAKRHIKSNQDTVSIQLPSDFRHNEMSELELTLSNLKEIVKKTKYAKRNKSCVSIHLNYKTSSDNYAKTKQKSNKFSFK